MQIGTTDTAVIAYDAEWGHQVRGARKVARLTQTQLAEAVGVTQPVISTIERGGETGSGGTSEAVLRICKVLKIPPPQVAEDPRLRRWRAVGVALLQSPKIFDYHLESLETLAQAMTGTPDTPKQ